MKSTTLSMELVINNYSYNSFKQIFSCFHELMGLIKEMLNFPRILHKLF